MALLNRPLTEQEMAGMLDAIVTPVFDRSWSALIASEHYQFVRYDAEMGRLVYEDPETFYWTLNESPSDCRWMVPGVVQHRRW